MAVFNPPKELKTRALKEWKRLLPYIKTNGFEQEEYIEPLATYCQAVQTKYECLAAIEEHGHLVESRQDTWARNPATMTLNQANQTILQISKLFGFTPADKKAIENERKKEDIAKADYEDLL